MFGKALSVVGLAALMAAPAYATTFNFTGGSNHYVTSHHFDSDGIGLDVTAGYFDGDAITEYGSGNHVGHFDNGLGLKYSSSDEHYVDGYGRNDVLIFRFDQEVDVNSVSFTYWDSNDQFTFFVFDGAWDNLSENVGSSNSWAYTYVFVNDYLGTDFGVGAAGYNDEFKISGMNVTAITSGIPEPATWLMMIMGFGLVGIASRRRSVVAAA